MSETNGHKPVNRITGVVAKKPRRNRAPVAKKTRKVAIVGKAPSSMNEAPYDDPEWEVWGVGDMGLSGKRLTRSFEVHDIHDGFTRWAGHYVDFLKAEHDYPIYVFDKHPEVKSAVEYPRREVLNQFAPLLRTNTGKAIEYFTNSISWMIALAIHEGVQEIGLWGVDMAQHGIGLLSEYAHQRPSCELFVGIAVGRGIKVTIHENSDLLKTPWQYGKDTEPHALRLKHKARLKDIASGKKKAAQKAQEFQDEIERLQGHLRFQESLRLGLSVNLTLQMDDPALATLSNEQKQSIAKLLAQRSAVYEAEREKITDKISQIDAGIKKLKGQQNEQVQRQLVHVGAEDDMSYWQQLHFG